MFDAAFKTLGFNRGNDQDIPGKVYFKHMVKSNYIDAPCMVVIEKNLIWKYFINGNSIDQKLSLLEHLPKELNYEIINQFTSQLCALMFVKAMRTLKSYWIRFSLYLLLYLTNTVEILICL